MKRATTAMAALAVLVLFSSTAPIRAEYEPTTEKFKACENKAGSGFYWTDTTTGGTWLAEPGRMQWVSCGLPKGAKPAPPGTYVPFENRSGAGVFVLNTATGEAWWTDGKTWKPFGKPATRK